MLSPRTSSRRLVGVGAALLLSLTACSSGSSSAPSAASATSAGAAATSAASAAATSAGAAPSTSASPAASAAAGAKVSLTFWSWVPNIDKIVAIWNTAHPNIHVNVNSQAQGDALVTKLLTADKAGNPPDLFQAEYQALPTLVSAGVAGDITKLVTPIDSKFTTGAWNLTSFSGARFGIPQDVGPMMMYYRADLFKQYGLAVPTTWDQYAAEAATVHAAHPKVYLGTFSSKDPGWFAGLSQQAKASWWSTDGDAWKVSVNDAPTVKVANYWNDLVTKGDIQSQPFFTPQWNAALANGTLLTWPSAIWAPGVLSGSAPKTKGDWEMAPLPAWTAGDTHVGYWGGSSTAVAAKSKNQAAAVQFASWLNTDPAAASALITLGSIYPASIEGQKSPQLDKPPAFMSNQPDFYKTAATIASNASGFTFGPNVNVTYGTYTDAFGKAILSKSPFAKALDVMQATTLADMKKSGFKATG